MTPAPRAPGGAYEGAGRQAAVAVRGYSSVVVTSDDIVAAAHTAIGIALAESAHRLVMIGDLGGEVAPLQALVRDDDPHGIFDSFEFGTSFVRISREVEGAANFFIMPSGTESAATERIIGNPRWRSFASEFANADELLLLVVHSDAPGLGRLLDQVDGAVLVGLQRLATVANANILAKIPHPVVAAPPKIDLAPPKPSLSLGKVAAGALGLLAAGILGGGLISRQLGDDGHDVPAAVADTVAVDSVPAVPAVLPANPQDSLDAVAYSVEILASNTSEGANFEMTRHGAQMPAATVSLVPIGDTEATWYKVHAGAFADSAAAEALLETLRRRRIVPDSAGTVIRAPFALMVDSVEAQAGMTARVREKLRDLSSRGVHAYALMQADGSARVYAGAFDRPDQSSLAATALRVAGLTPVLEYRKGRLP